MFESHSPHRPRTVVITGMGVVSPIGIGREAFSASLQNRTSGVRTISTIDTRGLSIHVGGEIRDFDPKQYVRPRKSLKVMSREIQFAFTAADLAMADAGLLPGAAGASRCDPDRLGVVFGSDMIYCELEEVIEAFRACMPEGRFDFSRWASQAMPQMYPLWLLKYLPNMPACHVAIANDARGPCNAHTLGDASSLSAVAEGFRLIQRGAVDCAIVGGTGCRLHPTCLTFRSHQWYSAWKGRPEQASRPFEAARSGQVPGEGAGAFILEAEDHARARGATIMARVLAAASRCEPVHNERPPRGVAIRASIAAALAEAQLAPAEIGHVNAHGYGTVPHDRAEAQAIQQALGDVPVTAPKSYFGNLGGGSGAVEMAASLLALERGEVPATLNYDQPDPECPIQVVSKPRRAHAPTALVLNQATTGQALALVLAAS
ncbi:MAG: beta-ketoacyl-[acyl-carrier-protein] synthase family protein [Pirellulales bacterium]